MKCAIAHCDNELSPGARVKTCVACRQVFYYWEKPKNGLSPVERVIKRQGQLRRWQDRMAFLADLKPQVFRRARRHLRNNQP